MLKVIKLSKKEQQARMSDPDWVYIDPKQYRRRMKLFEQYISEYKGKVIATPVDGTIHNFKKLWQNEQTKK